ncbi:helix-turn-helix transcriptional regulator [uncultured Bartonella sp.]|uniref:helix-turn-helix transcriptional regulator n=1 Tax=uncultured Bartonella sp. TaxID=104108 RepID=UPI002600E91F|nr:helix-turn-helix transcriptional regulator [uncultured Bartonella sp.]
MAKGSGITVFATLRAATGLSLFETADYLNVSQKNVERWVDGVREPPEGVIKEMAELVALQTKAVDRQLSFMKTNGVKQAEIGYPVDDEEANSMGWPCIGAVKVVLGRIIAGSEALITLSPRGSTSGTAAAIDAREK